MKKLLFLTPELPYPATSGGKLKSLQLLNHFKLQYKVGLACGLKGDDHNHTTAFLNNYRDLDCVMMHSMERTRSGINWLRSIKEGCTLNEFRSHRSALESEVATIINDYDLVFIDHYELARYVPASYEGHRIYHAHNAYHQLWQSYASQGWNIPLRLAAAFETSRVERREVAICNRADLVLAAPNDLTNLVASGADAANMRCTYHLGDESTMQLPDLSISRTREQLVYTGTLSWEPNRQGLIWFIRNVWPKVLESHPKAQLLIAGKGACPKIKALSDTNPGVRLLGFVEDLERVFCQARVAIAPLHFGAGMKVKVLTSLGRGLPTVTTPTGVEGMEIEHGRHLMVSETADTMASDISKLLSDDILWQRLSREGRNLVRQKYSWQGLFLRMDYDIAQLNSATPAIPATDVTAALL